MARINGIDIAYVLAGSGPVVVLVHGLACGRRMWLHQVRALRSSFTVLAYDQRGHGLSSAPEDAKDYSPAHLASDLIGLLDHLCIERCHIVGFSLGGGPALAASARGRAQSLVLADIGSGAENPALLSSTTRRWIALGRREGGEALADEMLRSEFFKTYANRSSCARSHMRALILRTPLHGLLFTLSEVMAKRTSLFHMNGILKSLTVPALVMRGERDNACRAASKLLVSSIPDASLIVLPKAGHMTPLEAPRAFNASLSAFLRGQ